MVPSMSLMISLSSVFSQSMSSRARQKEGSARRTREDERATFLQANLGAVRIVLPIRGCDKRDDGWRNPVAVAALGRVGDLIGGHER